MKRIATKPVATTPVATTPVAQKPVKRIAWFAAALLAVAAVLAVAAIWGWRRSDAPDPAKANLPEIVDATALKSTDIVADLDAPLAPGRNVVWCGTFQLAWNRLVDDVLKSPVRLEGDPPLAAALAQRRFSQRDLGEDSFLAIAGKVGDGVLARLRDELARKFPHAGVEVPHETDPNTLVAFAYLEKSLPFREPFDRLGAPLRFAGPDGPTAVAAYGFDPFYRGTAHDAALQEQLQIVDWKSPDDFVIRLISAQPDTIVLAKVAPGATLAATMESVLARLDAARSSRGFGSRIEVGERLAIPIIRLGVRKSFDQLLGRRLLNAEFQGWFVREAQQVVRFRLDETGAQLASTGTVVVWKSEPQVSRTMIFDKPFLLLLREPGKRPYLAMWIATPELLEPAPG